MMPLGHGFSPELLKRAAQVTALVIDVDGVLTDGRIVYAEHGDELKFFDVQDGAGLVFWHRAGLKSAIITARTSRLMKRRSKEMRVDVLVQGAPESLSGHSASVVDREPAGARSWVTLRWGSAEIKAETSSDFRIPQNHSVEVAINTERLHIFDAASGARLPWIALPPERQHGYK